MIKERLKLVMQKIAVFCVNYNSYDSLRSFLASVEEAASNCPASVSVYIADNTEVDVQRISVESLRIKAQVFAFNENLGYFGAVNRMMRETDVGRFDYVIISNVDVLMVPGIFSSIIDAGHGEAVGWIAPQIYSLEKERDINPQAVNRYPRRKLKMLRLMFSSTLLTSIYRLTFFKRSRGERPKPGRVYAGHGSFIILTKEYFKRCGVIDYPNFLYGEELYLAEQCRIHGLEVCYDPTIVVKDMEHVSTKKLCRSFYCRCNYAGLDHILKTYYR